MPIQINLLAEAQAAEELRRRDPVKRGIFIGISLVALALAWSGMVGVDALMVGAQLTGAEMQLSYHTNAYQSALSQQQTVDAIKSKLAQLDKLQSSRFLQGNLLDALQHATVDNVQLTRLRVDQSYSAPSGNQGDNGGSGRTAKVQQNVTLHLDAKDFSSNPGDQVNKFMAVIARQSYFQAMLEKTNGVQLTSPPSASQADGGKPYVSFELDCDYSDQAR
jgi:hypothetical protein